MSRLLTLPPLALLLLLLLAAVCETSHTERRARRSPTPAAPPAHSWLNLLSEYSRVSPAGAGAGAGADGDGGWFPRPLPLTLQLGRDGDNKPVSVPLLVLPVPVPAPAPAPAPACPAAGVDVRAPPVSYPSAPSAPSSYPSSAPAAGEPILAEYYPTAPVSTAPADAPEDAPAPPHLDYVVSSQQLVELFRSQRAALAHLPPALIPDYVTREEGREPPAPDVPAAARIVRRVRAGAAAPPPPPAGALRAPAPAPPAWAARSLYVRGAVTVSRAGYTEPYEVRYDGATGAARVDLHGGATVASRAPLPDGRVQLLEMRLDRSGAADARRCARAPPRPPSAADRAPPALPDLRAFSFAGESHLYSVHSKIV